MGDGEDGDWIDNPLTTSIGTLEWRSYVAPSGQWALDPIWATGHGLVAARRGAPGELWWSQDALTWNGVVVPADHIRVVPDGDDIVLLGDPAHRFTWERAGWVQGVELAIPADSGEVVFAASDAVAIQGSGTGEGQAGTQPAFAVSHDRGDTFHPAERPPAAEGRVEVVALLRVSAGFLALTRTSSEDGSSGPATEVWTSSDGDVWTSRPRPDEWDGMHAVDAQSDGKRAVVALGDNTYLRALWYTDDGTTWTQAELGPENPALIASTDHAHIQQVARSPGRMVQMPNTGTTDWFAYQARGLLAVGELGWLMWGIWNDEEYGSQAPTTVLWTSPDGRVWDNYPSPVEFPLAVGADLVFGQGEVYPNRGAFRLAALVPAADPTSGWRFDPHAA